MRSIAFRLPALALGCLAFAINLAMAAPQVYFGEDINRTATGQNEDAVRILHPLSDLAHSSFLANLVAPVTENFESAAPNSTISTLTFGASTATLTPGLQVISQPSGTLNGAYPISGNQFLLQNALGTNTFSIAFGAAQSAFGFYATDIEVQGNLTIRLLSVDGTTNVDYVVPTRVNPTPLDNNTGSVDYWGIVDKSSPFIRATFIRNLNAADGFGFDDMTIATPAQVVSVPETSTYMLLSAGLLALLVTKRPKRRANAGAV